MVVLQNDLFQLLRGYSALVPIKDLPAPSQLPVSLVHDFLLNSILLDPHLQSYPPSDEYQFSFWKWAIQWLEDRALDEAGFAITTG
jgi:protein-lysine N-methyltransferase EEF2KMT